MSDSRTKIIVGAAVAVGTITAASLAYLYKKKSDEPIPTNWKKVGEIVDLNCFPVASCAPIKRNSFGCHKLGVECDGLFDRCFIVTRDNQRIVAQNYSKVVLIQPKVIGNHLVLTAPGRSDFELNLDELRNKTRTKVDCKHTRVIGIDAGDQVADWLSEYLLGEPGIFRLVFYPLTYPTKEIAQKDRKYKALREEDMGTYHGKSSFMMVNQKSVDELNALLDHPVKPLQFRPNFIVNGPQAFDEDKWKWVRVGEHTTFRVVRPCNRCPFTTVNPDNGIRHSENEPFRTLTRIRSIYKNESPVMGIQLGLRVAGNVSIGDAVYVNEDSKN